VALDAIYLFSLATPERVYRWSAEHLRPQPEEVPDDEARVEPEAPRIALRGGVAALPEDQDMMGLVVMAGELPTSLFRLELRGRDLDGLARPSGEEEDVIVELRPDAFTPTELRIDASAFEPSVSPDGRHVTFAYLREGMRGAGIAVIELVDDGGEADLRLLTPGELSDSAPRFTRDGRHIVFQRRVPVSVGSRALSAPLAISVDPDGP
jgi:hypothetical protein